MFSHWALHGIVLVGLLWWIAGISGIPLWAYMLLFAWPGSALIQLRGYAEHRAAPDVAARTATIEAGSLLGFLFLHNNLHALHHAEPTLAWHRRPARYRAVRTDLLRTSRYHLIANYAQLARNHLFEAKEPLLHPSLVRKRCEPVRTARKPGYRAA